MHIIKEDDTRQYNGPYPARQKTKDGYIWYANSYNTFTLTESGLGGNIGNFREGGACPGCSLKDLSEAKFPSNFVNTCIPGNTTKFTATEQWYTLTFVEHPVSPEIICELIFKAQEMSSE
jgi:hypothetical protein